MLHLCYINDLPNCVKSQVRLFADDSLLYRTINSVHDAIQLQEDLTALEVWANTWKMHFNPTKCYMMRYSRSRTLIITPYILCNHKLAEHVTNPYLGVLLSNDAKWSQHISAICKQANATLGFLRRNLYNCPKDLKKLAYIVVVCSKLEYASCVWNPYLVKDITHLEKIQRRSARFICCNYDWSKSVTDMLRDLELETLEDRRSTASICMFFKIINNEVAKNQNEHLERSSSSTRRSHKPQYKHFGTSTEAYKNSFFPRSVLIWNKLNSNVVINLKTLNKLFLNINHKSPCAPPNFPWKSYSSEEVFQYNTETETTHSICMMMHEVALQVRHRKTTERKIATTIGIPQGDSLSLIHYSVYTYAKLQSQEQLKNAIHTHCHL